MEKELIDTAFKNLENQLSIDTKYRLLQEDDHHLAVVLNETTYK